MGAENRVEYMARRETARLGRCFNYLFGIPFRPGALLTLKPMMVLEPHQGG